MPCHNPCQLLPVLQVYRNPKPIFSPWIIQPKPGGLKMWFLVGFKLNNWYQELSQHWAVVSDGYSATGPPHQDTCLQIHCWFILKPVFKTELLLYRSRTSLPATSSWTFLVPLFVSFSFSIISFNAPWHIGLMGSYCGAPAIHHYIQCFTKKHRNKYICEEYNQLYASNQDFYPCFHYFSKLWHSLERAPGRK